MDMIFDIIQRLLEERKKTVKTEEEQKKCTFIQQCLECRPLFYTLDYRATYGMFCFLGETDQKRINEYIGLLNLPQVRAKYAYRNIIYPDQQKNNSPKKL